MDRIVETELDLVGRIYDAVLDQRLWTDTIDRIRRYMGLQNGVISSTMCPGA